MSCEALAQVLWIGLRWVSCIATTYYRYNDSLPDWVDIGIPCRLHADEREEETEDDGQDGDTQTHLKLQARSQSQSGKFFKIPFQF